MSLYFADNQSKQAAFDRTYNARARSDYAQGRKLQALIKKENIDDALTDQLASLYANTLRKAGEYEYDRINRALKKSAPEILVKGEAPAKPKPAKSGRTRVYKESEAQTETKEPLEEKSEIPAEIPLEPYPDDPEQVTQELLNQLAVRANGYLTNLNDMNGWERGIWERINPLIHDYMHAIIDRRVLGMEKNAQGKWDQSKLLESFPQNIREALLVRELKWPGQVKANVIDGEPSSTSAAKRKRAYNAYVRILKNFVDQNFPGQAQKPASPVKKASRKNASPITPEASTARA